MQDIISRLAGDTNFWVAVSTVVCFVFLGVKARHAVAAGLQEREDSIRKRLEEAEQLRTEAEAMLEDARTRVARATQEAEQILADAGSRAEQLRAKMEADLAAVIAREEMRAQIRMNRMHDDVTGAIKDSIITQAVAQVEYVVANDVTIPPSIETALADVASVLKK